jgi:dihydroorotate dehydrogenase
MGWFSTVGRPLMFAVEPESAHRVAIAMLGLPLPWERIGGVHDDPSLRTNLAGIPLANPIGLAAGFDKGCGRLDALGRLGFGFVVGGTITMAPREGNPRPRIARDRRSRAIVNAMGLPNPGARAVAATLSRTPRTAPRLVSLADESRDDVLAAAELLAPHVDGFELNASSPNAGWEHRADHVGSLLDGLRQHVDAPVFVKLPPFGPDDGRKGVLGMAAVAEEHGAAGLTCSNTWPVTDTRMSTGRGGLSGGPLTSATPAIVAAVRETTRLPISACGGVFTAAEATACLGAGATTVQVYTGLIYRGPGIAGELVRGLRHRVPDPSTAR